MQGNTDLTASSPSPAESPNNPKAGDVTEYGFTFSGTGGEYFRIWIVNLSLSIITLGIYSAWGKVRTARYFYGNTRVASANFDYLADPITILKGRLIAVAALVVYAGVVELIPGVAIILLFIIGLPWLIVRAMAFRARNSAYRNIRFNFCGKTGTAAKEFVAFPLLLLPLTLGLIVPYLVYRQTRFIVSNHRYGKSNFAFNGNSGDYFTAYLIAFGAMIALILYFLAIGTILIDLSPSSEFVIVLSAGFFILAIIVYLQISRINLFFNNTSLAQHGFRSSLKLGGMLWIHITNLLGMICTLGLFYPWAKVRMARYRAAHLEMAVAGDLNSFVADQAADISATGEELGEALDVEFGI